MFFLKTIAIVTFFALLATQFADAATAGSEIKDFNYVCMHVTKPEALVFKTSAPQKIWRTTIDRTGQITKGKAFELSQPVINAQAINRTGELASFQAKLAKNYQIKGYFAKDTDGELPLTVVSTYLPDGSTSQLKDRYNCEAETTEKVIQLGAINKE